MSWELSERPGARVKIWWTGHETQLAKHSEKMVGFPLLTQKEMNRTNALNTLSMQRGRFRGVCSMCSYGFATGLGVGRVSQPVLTHPRGDTQRSGALAHPPVDPELVGLVTPTPRTGNGRSPPSPIPTAPMGDLKASVASGAGL